MKRIIHHYTSIETLSLILESKRIRFNRLDNVDDTTEADTFNELKLGEFFFVSCWTLTEKESIPQWNMYTPNMAGVRISLPEKMFNYTPIKSPDCLNGNSNGAIYTPIPFEEWATEEYFIMPDFTRHEWFSRPVKYREDYVEQKNKRIEVKFNDGKVSYLKLDTPSRIAALKDPDWAFQEEFRFVLVIFPNKTKIHDLSSWHKFHNQLMDIMVESLSSGNGSSIQYYDMTLSPSIFDEMTITLGPLCTHSEKIIVDALISKYAPMAKIKESSYTGTLRQPRRA